MKKWILSPPNEDAIENAHKITRYGDILLYTLAQDGRCTDLDLALLEKDEALTAPLPCPFLIEDMGVAANTIHKHIEAQNLIIIYGDYDCDGITATTMLYTYLLSLGANVKWYIPERSFGFGISDEALDIVLEEDVKLIITVDNGITACKEAERISESGVQLVITDHHLPFEEMPKAAAIVDPNMADDAFYYKDLAGCGIAFMLIKALSAEVNVPFDENFYLQLAAVGTVADIVPLLGLNRYIVTEGIKYIRESPCMGLKALGDISGMDVTVATSSDISFLLAPRLNAAGRLRTASLAVELLLSVDKEESYSKALALNALNGIRRNEEVKIQADILQQIEDNQSLLYNDVLIFSGKNWHAGVVGIVASKIVDRFDKPCILLTIQKDTATGSCRSVKGFSVHSMLEYCGKVLDHFGGHQMAGGFSLKCSKISEFRDLVSEFCSGTEVPKGRLNLAKVLNINDFEVQNVKELSLLEPFGEGNKLPTFLIRGSQILEKKSLKDGKYISFSVEIDGASVWVIDFKHTYLKFPYNIGDTVDVAVTLDTSTYKGIESVSAKLCDIRLSGFIEDVYVGSEHTFERIMRGEPCAPHLIPKRSDICVVYDMIKKGSSLQYIKESTCLLDRDSLQSGNCLLSDCSLGRDGLQCCRLMIILALLEQSGLLKIEKETGKLTLIESEKIDIMEQPLMKRLKEQSEPVILNS